MHVPRTTGHLQMPTAPKQEGAKSDSSAEFKSSAQYLEKRRERRYPAHENVEVQVIGASGSRFGGLILEVSRSGLKLEIGKPLSQGAHLEILLPRIAIIIGEARYCRPKNKLYNVGVKIEGVYFTRAVSVRHVPKEWLVRYRSLPPLAAVQVTEHLASCDACRAALSEVEEMLAQSSRSSAPTDMSEKNHNRPPDRLRQQRDE